MKIRFRPKSVIPWIKSHRKQSLWITLGSFLFIVLLILFCPKSVRIATAEVQKGEFIIDLATSGEIDALNSTTVSVPRMHRRFNLQIVDMPLKGRL
jgi:hypothetical protein